MYEEVCCSCLLPSFATPSPPTRLNPLFTSCVLRFPYPLVISALERVSFGCVCSAVVLLAFTPHPYSGV